MDNAYVSIYSGEKNQILNATEIHPVEEVKRAFGILSDFKNNPISVDIVSNNYYFIFAMKCFGLKMEIEVQFFLDGVCKGNDIEEIFQSFNKAPKLVESMCLTLDKHIDSDSKKKPIIVFDGSNIFNMHHVILKLLEDQKIFFSTKTHFTDEEIHTDEKGIKNIFGVHIDVDAFLRKPSYLTKIIDNETYDDNLDNFFDKPKSKYHK
jgi:hypothetical protein